MLPALQATFYSQNNLTKSTIRSGATENIDSAYDTELVNTIERIKDHNPTEQYETYSYSVSTLLVQLESTTLGTVQNRTDAVALCYIKNHQTAAFLLRPKSEGERFQIGFAFRNKLWRTKKTMQLSLLRVTLKGLIRL